MESITGPFPQQYFFAACSPKKLITSLTPMSQSWNALSQQPNCFPLGAAYGFAAAELVFIVTLVWLIVCLVLIGFYFSCLLLICKLPEELGKWG